MSARPLTASPIDHEELLEVLSAARQGDFSSRMRVRGSKANRAVAAALNDIIVLNDQLGTEFERVARAVAADGRVEVRAKLKRAPGQWGAKVNSVNALIGAFAAQRDELGRVIGAVARGDLSKKLAHTAGETALKGDFLRTARLVNGMVDQLSAFASEVTRVAREVGTEGKLGGEAVVAGLGGTWKDLTDNVIAMATNLTTQVRNIAEVTAAVAAGDLSKKITVDVRGELLEVKNTINTMVDQLNSFASEVTRVAREVGTEGKLGGQAVVKGVGGTWKDLTDNVNSMASNLTTQVRGIAKVVTHVANGDLKHKLVLDVKGEISELADTINGLIDTLALFADQVTTVAREVGIEGKLGGQARVPGTAGLWRDLTDNVNQLAANLTTQVRAIAEVATAVTKGDLTRFVTVGAEGEVAALKDNINEMIRNLKDTTRKNTEQDWLKTNLTRFTRMLQGERDLSTVSKVILSELAPLINAPYAALYVAERLAGQVPEQEGPEEVLRLTAGYAAEAEAGVGVKHVKKGVGLVGQCAADRQAIFVSDLPNDYARVGSGLGSAPATHLVVLPVLFEGELKAVLELGGFRPFSDVNVDFLKQLTHSIGIVLNTIGGTTRTETLLQQSQALTEELKEINKRLEQQKTEVEYKNREVSQAKAALEEKAEQLSLASRYKSEFLANMSHELRTPLNSLLLLSQYLAENTDGNLSTKQIDFARTINSAGTDLLEVIDDILDLAKIESGTVEVNPSLVRLLDLSDFVDRNFRQLAEKKGLVFQTQIDTALPPMVFTDLKRLQQVLRNLLSNAFKFTDRGSVILKIFAARSGFSPDNRGLMGGAVFGFSVTDTGIGIPREKHRLIFEAFQQADGTTSRRYGGTGLGLSISRELAKVLDGELAVESEPEHGSTFTLYLPERYRAAHEPSAVAPRVQDALPRADREAVRAPADSFKRVEPPAGKALLMVTEGAGEVAGVRELAQAQGLRFLSVDHIDGIIEAARGADVVGLLVDLALPGRDGSIALDRLKRDVTVRHLPVWLLGAPSEEDRARLLSGGAAGIVPASLQGLTGMLGELAGATNQTARSVLVVDSRRGHASGLSALISDAATKVEVVHTLDEAALQCSRTRFDCMVIARDDAAPSARAQLRTLADQLVFEQRPRTIFFAEAGDPTEEWRWAMNPQAGWVVTFAQTPERLVELTTRALHRALGSLPFPQQSLVRLALATDRQLAGRTVLVIDDDVRNIFAITTALEHYDIHVLHAESAADGLKRLEENPAVDLVLMDVMMPEMDGYEATRAIRARKVWAELPVVALTAKAMKGDREKCLAAGASDYIAKPVNVDKLTSVLRVWLAPRAPAPAQLSPLPTAVA